MFTRKTKIVCSMGPATADDAIVEQLVEAGMNVARFNFSHGSHQSHQEAMERVRRAAKNCPGILDGRPGCCQSS